MMIGEPTVMNSCFGGRQPRQL